MITRSESESVCAVSYTHLEDFGTIYAAGEEGPGTKEAVRLGEMKAFSNYGMILKPETEGDAYPALVVNCQQDVYKRQGQWIPALDRKTEI